MGLPEQIAFNLEAQRASLVADWSYWVKRVSEGGELQQHNSQVNTIQRRLEAALKAALENTPLGKTPLEPPATIDLLSSPRRAIEVIYLLWAFFREKLSQRDSERFRLHLLVADDLAWECFAPMREAYMKAADASKAADAPREPPLVFYFTERAPSVELRTSSYAAPGVTRIELRDFNAAVNHLAVPLIGVPQSHSGLIPPLVFVGHEVGHVVAEDFGLLAEAKDRVAAIDLGNRRDRWMQWVEEVFSDVFALLATGSAYAEQLAGLLAFPSSEVMYPKLDGDQYRMHPPAAVRMAACNYALEKLAGEGCVRQLDYYRAWQDAYGDLSGELLRAFMGDVPKIVDAILANYAGLGGKSLADVLPWDAAREEELASLAQTHLFRGRTRISFSVRLWVAAAARASVKDPAQYGRKDSNGQDCDQRIAKSIEENRSSGPYAKKVRLLRGQKSAAAPARAEDVEADKAAGRELATFMGIAPISKEET